MPAMMLGAPLFGLSRFVLAVVLGLAALFAFAVAAGFVWRAPADNEASRTTKRTRTKRRPAKTMTLPGFRWAF